MSWLMNV